jgi:DNA-binding Lrp family transcriptional regulator
LTILFVNIYILILALYVIDMINHNSTRSNGNNNNNANNNNRVNKSLASSPVVEFSPTRKIDPLDVKIMSLMVSGLPNKQIAGKLKVPLSTIQRRTRKLIEKGMMSMRAEVNLQMMGFKKGLIHVYISNGNIDQIARKISSLEPIESVEIHIGNSDMIGNVIYGDSRQLLQTISDIKKIEGVDKIVWSEEVFNIKNNENNMANLLNFKS